MKSLVTYSLFFFLACSRLTIPLDVPLSQCSRGRYKVRVPFDLRNDQGRTVSEQLIPSFKTANAEREVGICS